MPFLTATPNMGLPLPIIGQESGPQYGTDQNNAFSILDGHNHASGSGVQINPAGLNINSDLPFNSNNATMLRTTRYTPQVSAITASSPDLGCIYFAGVDLYCNDLSGNQIRITQSGAVTGSAGTITGLPTGTASAAYVSASGTFVFQQATSTGANIDGATMIIRYPGSYPSPSGNFIAIQAPSSLATGYEFTLPATLPGASASFLTSDTSGNIGYTNVDNSTLQYATNVISIKNLGVGTAQLAANAVTNAKLASLNYMVTSSSGTFSTTSTSPVSITNLSGSLTTVGRPVNIHLQPDGSSFAVIAMVDGAVLAQFILYRGNTPIANWEVNPSPTAGGSTSWPGLTPFIDVNAPSGANTYTMKCNVVGSTTLQVTGFVLFAYEL